MHLLNLFIGLSAALVINIQPEDGPQTTVEITSHSDIGTNPLGSLGQIGRTTPDVKTTEEGDCQDLKGKAFNYEIQCNTRTVGGIIGEPEKVVNFSQCLESCNRAGSRCPAFTYDKQSKLCSMIFPARILPFPDSNMDIAFKKFDLGSDMDTTKDL